MGRLCGVEESWASGQMEMWLQVWTVLPTWLLEFWVFLDLCFLTQNRVIALHLGLAMIQYNKTINIKEL